ncbi:hypothetical protein DD238_002594 [Peronospora effusa]|uniref:Uncharacterized protein n=1 Tax=Peronospora effusa TaxID=542832 RepID=A0A3M6VD88_9STRA|nr:hypothetical protein DD238_002594 [Peronospora effusa]
MIAVAAVVAMTTDTLWTLLACIEAFLTAFIGQINRNPSDERSNLKRVCKTCSSVFDERAKQAKESSPGGGVKWSKAFKDRVVGFAWGDIEKKDDTRNFGSSRNRSLAT